MNAISLDRQVTLYKDVKDTIGNVRTLRQCLEHIRSHKTLAELIPKLRPLYWWAEATGADEDKAAYEEAKKKLPAFTMSGTFTKRGIAGLENYSNVIQADLDHLQAKGFKLGELRARVIADPHVLFCFTSPSGDGLKIGILVSSGPEEHTEAFLAMQRYFEHTYGIRPDDKCKDLSRLCFLSHDPDLFINEAAQPFNWRAWPGSLAIEPEAEEEEETACPLPLDAFPPIMQELANACGETYQVDVALPAAAAITIMAAGLGKSVRCTGAVNGRETPCNLFTVISAPPSYGKGVVGIVAKPLIDASTEMSERFELIERPQLKADISIAEGRKKELLAEMKGGKVTAIGMEEARAELGRLEGNIEKWTFAIGQLPAYYTGSATGAALGVALKRNDEQLLSLALEAGDAIRIAAGRYTPDNKGDYDLFLSAYTGEPYAESRITRPPMRMKAPCGCILWSVQPSLLRELFGTQEAQERGLLARINVIECGHDLMPEDDGIAREVPAKIEAQWNELVRAALELRKAASITTFCCEPDAREIFRRFHNEAVALRNGEGREHESKLGRCRENAIRIALVIAAMEWLEAGTPEDAPVLSAEHAARGVALAQYFLAQTINLTRSAAAEKREARLAELLNIAAKANGQITLRRLRDHHNYGEVEVRQIVERNPELLRIETPTPTEHGGRPSTRLVVIQKSKI